MTMRELVSFENTFADEEPENGIICQVHIDGYTANEEEEGEVVAKVILSKHGDIVTVWQNNGYRSNPLALELVNQTVEDMKNGVYYNPNS